VDGCPGGWVAAVIDESRAVVCLRVLKTFAEVVIITQSAELVLVDIPIGLPSKECARGRLCDVLVRKDLGPRAASVFPVPAREAVWAEDYEEACGRNLEILGRKLSKQSWGICPKIREVDAVFRIAPQLQLRMRETHPELCFRWLNGGRALANPKRSPAGRLVRRELLLSRTTNLAGALEQARRRYPARLLGMEDMLDAVAAAVLAQQRETASVPLAREYDACGLAMEIVGVW
jgi:predicted RNase H-like nuclease